MCDDGDPDEAEAQGGARGLLYFAVVSFELARGQSTVLAGLESLARTG